MKNIFKKIGLGILGVAVFTALLGLSTPTANAEVNTNFWTRIAGNIIKTNPSVLKLQVPGTPGGAGCLQIDASGNITSIGSNCGSSSGNMAIGNVVAGGSPNEVLYMNASNQLESDNGFIRDSANNFTTYFQSTDGANQLGQVISTNGISYLESVNQATTDVTRVFASNAFARQQHLAASGAFSISQQASTQNIHTWNDGVSTSATLTLDANGFDGIWSDGTNSSQIFGNANQSYIYHTDGSAPGLIGVADATVVPTTARRILFEGNGDTLQIYHPSVIDIQGGGSFALFDNPNDALNLGAGSATDSTINLNTTLAEMQHAEVSGDISSLSLSTEATLNFAANAGSNTLFQATGTEARSQFDDGNQVTSTMTLNGTTGSVIFDDQNNSILSTLSVGSTGADLSHDGGQGIVSSLELDDTQMDLRWVSGAGITAFTSYDGAGLLTTRLNDTNALTTSYVEMTNARATLKWDMTPPATPSATISAEDIQSYVSWNDGLGVSNDMTLDVEQAKIYYSDTGSSIEGYIGVDNSGTPLAFDRGLQVDAANGGTTVKDPTNFKISVGATTWIWPTADGAANTVVKTDGSGNLSFGSVLTDSTWTPTAVGVANITAVTASTGQYQRSGNTVTFSITVLVDPTTTATFTEYGIPLPVASNFAQTYQASGTCFSGTVSEGQQILADITNDRLTVWSTPTDVTSQTYSCSGSYRII